MLLPSIKHTLLLSISLLFSTLSLAQSEKDRQQKLKEDFEEILSDIEHNYVYLEEKGIDLDCIREHYTPKIDSLNDIEEIVLFFEYILDEFYDSHLILNTNVPSSYRLFCPIYVTAQKKKIVITNVWQDYTKELDVDLIGAEVLSINKITFNDAIDNFPTHCQDKSVTAIREWLANKVLAGRYNQARILELKLKNGENYTLDLDKLTYQAPEALLSTRTQDGIGIITINNSLGNNQLIKEFDTALDQLMNTKGLIIDLRNTVDGGNTYVARGIMGRFIKTAKPYQKHWTIEQYDNQAPIERSWLEYVSPRGKQYKKKVVILVGRWTGSMGEGFAIGMAGMEAATIVGTEMERLAGEMNGFGFQHLNFGYRLSTAKLYHTDGTAREKYLPSHYIKEKTNLEDQILLKGLEIIRGRSK